MKYILPLALLAALSACGNDLDYTKGPYGVSEPQTELPLRSDRDGHWSGVFEGLLEEMRVDRKENCVGSLPC